MVIHSYLFLVSLFSSEDILLSIISSRDIATNCPANQKEMRTKLKCVISSETFVPFLKKGMALFEPIEKLIVKFKNDQVPVSEVYSGFTNLPLDYDVP